MELKLFLVCVQKKPLLRLNRTFYGIETNMITSPAPNTEVLIVPFMELKPLINGLVGTAANVLIVPFMELKPLINGLVGTAANVLIVPFMELKQVC